MSEWEDILTEILKAAADRVLAAVLEEIEIQEKGSEDISMKVVEEKADEMSLDSEPDSEDGEDSFDSTANSCLDFEMEEPETPSESQTFSDAENEEPESSVSESLGEILATLNTKANQYMSSLQLVTLSACEGLKECSRSPNLQFQCGLCQKTLRREDRILNHLDKEHQVSHPEFDEPLLQCLWKECTRKSYFQLCIENHLQTKHNVGRVVVRCPEKACFYSVADTEENRRLMDEHVKRGVHVSKMACSHTGCIYKTRLQGEKGRFAIEQHILAGNHHVRLRCPQHGCAFSANFQDQSTLDQHVASGIHRITRTCPRKGCTFVSNRRGPRGERAMLKHLEDGTHLYPTPCPHKSCKWVTLARGQKGQSNLETHLRDGPHVFDQYCPYSRLGCKHRSRDSDEEQRQRKMNDHVLIKHQDTYCTMPGCHFVCKNQKEDRETFQGHLIEVHHMAQKPISCSKKGCKIRSVFPEIMQEHEQNEVHIMKERYQDKSI